MLSLSRACTHNVGGAGSSKKSHHLLNPWAWKLKQVWTHVSRWPPTKQKAAESERKPCRDKTGQREGFLELPLYNLHLKVNIFSLGFITFPYRVGGVIFSVYFPCLPARRIPQKLRPKLCEKFGHGAIRTWTILCFPIRKGVFTLMKSLSSVCIYKTFLIQKFVWNSHSI